MSQTLQKVTINNVFDISKKADSGTGIFQVIEIRMGFERRRQRVETELWNDVRGELLLGVGARQVQLADERGRARDDRALRRGDIYRLFWA